MQCARCSLVLPGPSPSHLHTPGLDPTSGYFFVYKGTVRRNLIMAGHPHSPSLSLQDQFVQGHVRRSFHLLEPSTSSRPPHPPLTPPPSPLQDPFLYKGTVRRNLDPLERYSDPELWEALEMVGLKAAITALELGLDFLVVDNGANFSLVGAWLGSWWWWVKGPIWLYTSGWGSINCCV